MKFTIVFAAVLAVSSAQIYRTQPSNPRPAKVNSVASNDQNANTVHIENDISPDGSYNYAYETDNGIQVSAQGTPRDFGGNPPVVPVVSQGSYSYYSPEGQLIKVTYNADENGFQPASDVLPTPPPVPEYILRALDWIEKNSKKN